MILKKIFAYYMIKKNPVEYARSLGVQIGEEARLISIKPMEGTFGSEPYLVKIGNHVTVAGDVKFFTHDGGVWIFREKDPDIDIFGSIEIGDNVFIGYGSTILPNVKVGNDVVIGAKSVVTKDIPDETIVAGVPAKIIKTKSEYYESIKGRKMNIRGISLIEKKRVLIEKYINK